MDIITWSISGPIQGQGAYPDQVERWLEHFDRDQLLVIFTEELQQRRSG